MTSTKFLIQAVARPGFDGSWRAGRKWLSSEATQVEVFDQDEDPPATDKPGVRIGRKTFAILQADTALRIAPIGNPIDLARAMDTSAALKGAVTLLEQERDALKARVAELEQEAGSLKGRVADLEAQLAASAEGKSKGKAGKGEPKAE